MIDDPHWQCLQFYNKRLCFGRSFDLESHPPPPHLGTQKQLPVPPLSPSMCNSKCLVRKAYMCWDLWPGDNALRKYATALEKTVIHSQLYIKKLLPPNCRHKSLGKGQRDGLEGQGSAAKPGTWVWPPGPTWGRRKLTPATCSLTSMFVLWCLSVVNGSVVNGSECVRVCTCACVRCKWEWVCVSVL